MKATSNPEYMTFHREWLPLDKKDFRILAMLADRGKFHGTLSNLCDYFSLSRQTRNCNQLRDSIQRLQEQGLIDSQLNGRTYALRAIPKGKEIELPRRWAEPIIQHEYASEPVAWENVLKVFVWIHQNRVPLITNADIARELNISTDTITNAKNVLEKDFRAITREIEKITLADGSKRNIGQRLGAVAEWSE